MIQSITIEGFLVGRIWQGVDAFKSLNYDAKAQQRRTVGKMSLRDHLLAATLDGDFAECLVAAGTLYVDTVVGTGATTIRRTRSWPLDRFPSIKDMLHDDPDWLPPDQVWPDEESEAVN